MPVEILHGEEVHVRIVEIHARRVLGHQPVLDAQRFGLDTGPVYRQRPVATHQTQVGQRLLDHNGPVRIIRRPDFEHEVQVSIADFLGGQVFAGTEYLAQLGARPHILDNGRGVQWPVVRGNIVVHAFVS